MTPMSLSHDSHVPVKITGPETETGNRYVGRKTRERLRGKPERKTGASLLAVRWRPGADGGWLTRIWNRLFHIRVEISPDLYKNLFAKNFGYSAEYL